MGCLPTERRMWGAGLRGAGLWDVSCGMWGVGAGCGMWGAGGSSQLPSSDHTQSSVCGFAVVTVIVGSLSKRNEVHRMTLSHS